ncbi:MAG: F0F1 ATP synthase subunit epsilon [Chloroflexota bacterium]
MTIKVDIVTAEKRVFTGEVDAIVAPGVEGQLGILPHHAPLMTMLAPGELLLRKDNEETLMAISGGFLEVRPDRVIVLADSAERAEEIDIARAEAAKERARERLRAHPPGVDDARVIAALQRSLARLKVAEMAQKRKPRV